MVKEAEDFAEQVRIARSPAYAASETGVISCVFCARAYDACCACKYRLHGLSTATFETQRPCCFLRTTVRIEAARNLMLISLANRTRR